MKQKAKNGTRIIFVIMVVLIAVIAICIYKLYNSGQEYAVGDDAYEVIRSTVLILDNEVDVPDGMDVQKNIIANIGIDLNVLAEQYENGCAWLYCPDTVINYPIMIAKDYRYYLNHLPDGTYNKNGSLFLDYNCEPNFKGRLSIVYGHNMKSGKMFGGLSMYKEKETLGSHPYLYLYTNQGSYRLEPLYGLVISADKWRDKGFMYEDNTDALIEYAKEHGNMLHTITEDVGQCRLTVLSTCTYEFDDARFVVICAMRQETGEIAATVKETNTEETMSKEIQH